MVKSNYKWAFDTLDRSLCTLSLCHCWLLFCVFLPHPSISSLVRQCEIVQIRALADASSLQRQKHSEGAFLLFFVVLVCFRLIQFYVSGAMGQSSLYQISPAFAHYRASHSEALWYVCWPFAFLAQFSLHWQCGQWLCLCSFATSYFTHYQIPLTFKLDYPIFKSIFKVPTKLN